MNFQTTNIPNFEPKEIKLPECDFLALPPNFDALKRTWREFGHFKNILVVGHGGSITSFKGMFSSLGNRNAQGHQVYGDQKNIFFLSTTDPEYISRLKHGLKKHDTLVIAISKTGETITQIEALLQFVDYPLIVITSPNSTLEQIGKKINAKIFHHPKVGGRFSAFTEAGMVPAAIAGLDVTTIFKGAQSFYAQYDDSRNIAYQAAQIFYALEQKGFVDVLAPFYSEALYGFAEFVIQLCHESFSKNGQGQTFLPLEGPESQHHSSQRLFDGRKNVAGFFIWTDTFRDKLTTEVPTNLHSIPLRDESLFTLNKIPLSYSMESEYQSTFTDARIKGIPAVSLNINLQNTEEIGKFIAFWQLFAVYSAVLRDVNPFDQPAVENSKKISWTSRKNFKYQ